MNVLLRDQVEWANREAHRRARRFERTPSPLEAFLALTLVEKLAVVAGGFMFAAALVGLPWVLALAYAAVTGEAPR